MKMIIVFCSVVTLLLIGLAIGIWFIPFIMWSVSAAGIAIPIVMPMIAQILIKGFISILCIGLTVLTVLGVREIF